MRNGLESIRQHGHSTIAVPLRVPWQRTFARKRQQQDSFDAGRDGPWDRGLRRESRIDRRPLAGRRDHIATDRQCARHSDAQQNTAGPVVADGFVFTATTARADFGDRNGYTLGDNGAWLDFSPWIGLNARTASMTLTFDTPVASFLAFLNYAPGNVDLPSIAAYDAANQLIEAFAPVITTRGSRNAGAWLGFGESENIIKSIQFSNSFIVATNLQVATVPEPESIGLFAFGVIAVVAARRSAGQVLSAVRCERMDDAGLTGPWRMVPAAGIEPAT